MNREELLNQIAQKGYNISYSANINFATYDIYTKTTRYISFFSLIGGILSLIYPEFFGTKFVATCLLFLGVIGIYIEQFTNTIDSYAQRGTEDTKRLSELKAIYHQCEDNEEIKDRDFPEKYHEILNEFYSQTETKQLIFAGWLAHFKMFSQKRHEHIWIEEQLGLTWWKDKLPSSFKVTIIFLVFCLALGFVLKCPKVQAMWFSCWNCICG